MSFPRLLQLAAPFPAMRDRQFSPMSDPFEEPVAPKELAPLLGRSVRWVQNRCAKGQIPTLPIGRPFRIPADEANRLAGLTGDRSHETTQTEKISGR